MSQRRQSVASLQLAEYETRVLVKAARSDAARAARREEALAFEEKSYLDAVSDENTAEHNAQLVERLINAERMHADAENFLREARERLACLEAFLEFEQEMTDAADGFQLDDATQGG